MVPPQPVIPPASSRRSPTCSTSLSSPRTTGRSIHGSRSPAACAGSRRITSPITTTGRRASALAYALDGGKGKPAKTVLRAGYGFFYDRFGSGNLLTINHANIQDQDCVRSIQPASIHGNLAQRDRPEHLLKHRRLHQQRFNPREVRGRSSLSLALHRPGWRRPGAPAVTPAQA